MRIRLTENEVINLLEEIILLEAMSLDQIYAAHYSEGKRKEIPEDVFYQIAEADPTKDGEGMGKYTDWMIGLYRKGNLKLEDLYKATQYLTEFHKFKNRIEKKDIGQYKSLPELYDVVKKYIDKPNQATSKSDEVRRIKQRGAKRLYEDERWLIIQPMTKKAAIVYGENTQWCTAASSSDNYYNDYVKDYGKGCLYINIDKQNNRKYQFCFESNEFMDETDDNQYNDESSLKDKLHLSDGVIKCYQKEKPDQWFKLIFAKGTGTAKTDSDPNAVLVTDYNKLYRIEGSEMEKVVELPDDYMFNRINGKSEVAYVFTNTAVHHCVDIFDYRTRSLIFDKYKKRPIMNASHDDAGVNELDGYYVDRLGVSGLGLQVFLSNDHGEKATAFYDVKEREFLSPLIDSKNTYCSITPYYWISDRRRGEWIARSKNNFVVCSDVPRGDFNFATKKDRCDILDCSTGEMLDIPYNIYAVKGGLIPYNNMTFGIGISYKPDKDKEANRFAGMYVNLNIPTFKNEDGTTMMITNDMKLVPLSDEPTTDEVLSIIEKHPLDPEHQQWFFE